MTSLAINSTAVQVSWDPPSQSLQNGIITSYTINLLEIKRNTSWSFSQNFLRTSFIIHGLYPYSEYIISVAAYTVAEGPKTFTTVTTLQDCKIKYCVIITFY